MNERLIILFAAVAEELSFVRAASRLNIAQPWLSAQIRKLEERLGFSLFFRTKGRIALTPEGERLLPAARRLARASDEAADVARAIEADVSNIVRLAAPHGVNPASDFGKLNDEFMQRFTRAAIEVDYARTGDVLARIRDGFSSIGLLFDMEVPEDLDAIVLRRCCPYLLMPNSLAGNTDRELKLEGLTQLPLATIRRNANPDFYDRLFSDLLDAGADLVAVPEQSRAAMEHYVERHGTSVIMIEGVAEDYADNPNLAARPLPFLAPVLQMLVRKQGFESRSVERYWQLAQTMIAQPETAKA